MSKDMEPHTPEERAIRLILGAEIETDEDYIALAKLIDDEVKEFIQEYAHNSDKAADIPLS